MFDFKKVDTTRLIVAQDEAIRQALNYGYGPEHLLRHYFALGDQQKNAFVAALAAMVSMQHERASAQRESLK